MSELVEEWRWIVGYEGTYQVSNIGRVKSFQYSKERILIAVERGRGEHKYLCVCLSKNKEHKIFNVHQLVCQAFNEEYFIGCGKVVNHINGDIYNNRIDNVEPRTARENNSGVCFRKNQELYTSQYDNVSWDKQHNKWRVQIEYNYKNFHLGFFTYEEEKEASELSKIALSHINNGTFEDYYGKLIDNRYIKINQYYKSGKFIREWNSATIAGKELNILNGDIGACCREKQKSAGGFKWSYVTDKENNVNK